VGIRLGGLTPRGDKVGHSVRMKLGTPLKEVGVVLAPPPPPSPRTKWTRRVPHPVLIGHAASSARTRAACFTPPRGAARFALSCERLGSLRGENNSFDPLIPNETSRAYRESGWLLEAQQQRGSAGGG
jgi:hypothetical protein